MPEIAKELEVWPTRSKLDDRSIFTGIDHCQSGCVDTGAKVTAVRLQNLDENVDLRFGKLLGQNDSFERLLQMHGHLDGLPVAVWPVLSLGAAERGHAALTVDDGLVVQALRSASSWLSSQSSNG